MHSPLFANRSGSNPIDRPGEFPLFILIVPEIVDDQHDQRR